MKKESDILERLQKLRERYDQANFRTAPHIARLINELEWVLNLKITDFD